MSNYLDQGPETLQKYFAGAKFIFLSVAEKICGSPLPEHQNFSKLLCRPCERRLTNFRSVIVTSPRQGSLHATQKWSNNFLPTSDARWAIYWHTFPRDQQQPWFFLEARERTQGARLLASRTQRKNAERGKPSCTAHFDILAFVILTREKSFVEGGGVASWPKSVNLLRDPGSKKHTS